MEELHEVRNVSVSIRRSPAEVYEYVTNGENVPRWAKGLGTSIRRVDAEWWLAEGPLGKVKVRFTPRNDLGVADHDVVLPTGAAVYNPIRVLPNGSGSTVVFTLLRLPGVSGQDFARDAGMVEQDLLALKALLERG